MPESGLEKSIRWILNLPQDKPGVCNTPEIRAHIDALVSMNPAYAEKCLDKIYNEYAPHLVSGDSADLYVSTIENLLGLLANSPQLVGHSKAAKKVIELEHSREEYECLVDEASEFEQSEHAHHCVDKAIELFGKYDAELAEKLLKLLVKRDNLEDGISDALTYLVDENTEDMSGADFKNQIRAMHNTLIKLWGVLGYHEFAGEHAAEIGYDYYGEHTIGYFIRTAIKTNPPTETLEHKLKWKKVKKFIGAIDDKRTYAPEDRAYIYAWFMSNCSKGKWS